MNIYINNIFNNYKASFAPTFQKNQSSSITIISISLFSLSLSFVGALYCVFYANNINNFNIFSQANINTTNINVNNINTNGISPLNSNNNAQNYNNHNHNVLLLIIILSAILNIVDLSIMIYLNNYSAILIFFAAFYAALMYIVTSLFQNDQSKKFFSMLILNLSLGSVITLQPLFSSQIYAVISALTLLFIMMLVIIFIKYMDQNNRSIRYMPM